MKRPLEVALWQDCETDEEKVVFVKSGRAVETGIIAPAISYEVGRILAQTVRMRDALERCRWWFDESISVEEVVLSGRDCSAKRMRELCEEALKC